MFLKLRKLAPEIFAVPPVDVDFIWHTHMSMNAQYHRMSLQHFGELVSHETVSPDDSARTFKRDSGFNGTQKAWAELFPGKAVTCSLRHSVHHVAWVRVVQRIARSLKVYTGSGSTLKA